MSREIAFAVFFVVGVWWLGTAVILKLVWLGRESARPRVIGLGLVAVASLVAITYASREPSSRAAYLSFLGTIAVWAFHELVFLLGFVTGSRKTACPSSARGLLRFLYATEVLLHHELSLAATFVLIIGLTWQAPNTVAAEVFAVLWIMRLSAKLNVFLGVRNLADSFIPEHLRYLLTYVRRARLNPLMPVSLLLAGGATVVLSLGIAEESRTFVVVGRTLVTSLLALAFVEHVFLALPVPDAWLWRWATRSRGGTT